VEGRREAGWVEDEVRGEFCGGDVVMRVRVSGQLSQHFHLVKDRPLYWLRVSQW
jgi:hypothetical protein